MNANSNTIIPQARPHRRRGIAMVLFSAICWGLSGTASQVLFQSNHFPVPFLVAVRMLASGIVLVGWGILRKESYTRDLIRDRRSWWPLIVFGVIGLLGVQFSYFKAIADGNAASATLLQYLGPPMILLYSALSTRRNPSRLAWIAMILALLGTLLLVTGGHFQRLDVPTNALLWGLTSAITLAFYTLYPSTLVRRFDAIAVVGVGMLLGGAVALFIGPVWVLPAGHWNGVALGLIAFVVLLGTLAAFSLYLASLQYLSAAESGLLATAEPVAAVAVSMLFLHVRLNGPALFGASLIILAIIHLSRKAGSPQNRAKDVNAAPQPSEEPVTTTQRP